MKLASVTPLILTFNEAPNLARSLGAVSWASQIVVIDSGSLDATEDLASQFSQVRFVTRPFDDHTSQWNFGLSLVQTEWVLTLDADYVCSDDLASELQKINCDADAYYAKFQYCVDGVSLRAALYPPRAVLFRSSALRYVSDGHTQTLDMENQTTAFLQSRIFHDDRKPLARWFSAQIKYAQLEAEKLTHTSNCLLSRKDRLRKQIVFAPALTFFYCLFAKRLIFDGWRGFYYSLQRVFAELLLSLILLDQKIRDSGSERRVR